MDNKTNCKRTKVYAHLVNMLFRIEVCKQVPIVDDFE